ncbi:MAG: FecR domain-containing protein, partial [Fibrobacter sp.]|nr:FecR domain-containing protein [Fibrobacter sp.]
MKCAEIRKKIQDFQSGTCSLSLYREISSHLEKCEECRKYESSLKKLLFVLKEQSPVEFPSEGSWERIENAVISTISKDPKPVSKNKFRQFFLSEQKMIAAAALVLFTVTCIWTVFKVTNKQDIAVALETEEQISYPKLVNTVGSISVVNDNEETYSKNNGLTIQTNNSSKTNVLLDKKTSISINNNTVCKIDKLSLDTQFVSLQTGNVMASVGKRERNQKFRINTPNAYCEVVGTKFEVSYSDTVSKKGVTRLAVYEGTVVFGTGSNNGVAVSAGYCIEAVGGTLGEPVQIAETGNAAKNKFTIISEPANAIVNINGKKAGLTPLILNIDTGDCLVNVYKNGFLSWEKHINLAKCDSETLKVKLLETSKKSTDQWAVSVSDSGLINKATALINAEKYDSALVVLNTIVLSSKAAPETKVLALTKISYCQSSMGRHDRAVAALMKIADGAYTDEQKGSALFRIAAIRKDMMRNYDGAIEVLRRYFREYPNGIWIEEVGFSLAELLVVKGRFADAAGVYESLSGKKVSAKNQEKLLYNLAQLYVQNLNDSTRALKT